MHNCSIWDIHVYYTVYSNLTVLNFKFLPVDLLLAERRLKTAAEDTSGASVPIDEKEFLNYIVDSVDDYWHLMPVRPMRPRDDCMVSCAKYATDYYSAAS